ncbi:MAG: D-alanyl-D-alanine carboxypeptidase [Rhodobacteraceae bacterium CG2_30_10_405]|nr:MAG: D-alanyl-D-alanine carboxypeptidase [Rhodobacteraceae bacterium CG2_30_10_405]
MLSRIFLILALVIALPAQAFETRATAAWVYDLTTGTVLLEKNADQPLPPASMSKLMTLNLLFEALRDGRVTLDTPFAVSARAKAMTGSTMFLNEMDRPTVNDLIHGIIINSGNDATVVVAEGLAGSEDAFAAQMTARAKALGMANSTFANASGWPDPNQRMSMHDLGLLASRLITEFPEYYPIFALTENDYADRAPDNRFNRNPLLRLNIGADGLKTGHTEEAGYGLIGSAVQGERRVVIAITGLTSERERAEESERLITWAFRQFSLKTVVKAGARVAEAEVWIGDAATVGLVSAQDVRRLLPAEVQGQISAEVVYTGPLLAPIAAGAKVAELVVHVPGLPDAHLPLVAETAVGKGGFLTRLGTAVQVLRARYWPQAS